MILMVVAVLLGALAGVVCGFVPGLHTNLIASGVLLVARDSWWWASFLGAFAAARSVADAVPSTFLGVSDDVLSLQPAQRLLMKGQGKLAVKCSVAGALLGFIACSLLVPLAVVFLPVLTSFAHGFAFWLVLAAVLLLIYREDRWPCAALLFALCGLFGWVALDAVREPLFPMLAGLFGGSALVSSLRIGGVAPFQAQSDVRVKRGLLVRGVSLGALAAYALMVVPGLGPSQGAALVSSRRVGPKGYLILTGALGTVDVVASMVMVAVTGRARNGGVVAVQTLVGSVSAELMYVLIAAAAVGVGLAAIMSLFVARSSAELYDAFDPCNLTKAVLAFLLCACLLVSGPLGLLVFVVGCALGSIAPLLNVSRSHAMGCLLLPLLFALW